MVVFGKSSCISAKEVVFRQRGFILAKVVEVGQNDIFREKVVVFAQK